jgi:endoglucanase
VRVDQLGYTPTEAKSAYLIARHATHAHFAVVDARGHVVLRGRAGRSRGRWNRRFGAVQPLTFTRLQTPGTYRVEVGRQLSPRFRIAPAQELLAPRVADAVAFFHAQRDGPDALPSPAHLNDSALDVFAPPRYESADSDVILGRALHKIGGPVDLEGGWMDAGDFVKFTHTTAYADTLLFAAERALGAAAPPTLDPEARFGLAFLAKAWRPHDRTMLLQVGIGSGNKRGTFNGDHDVWRLPARDDRLKGARNRYLRHRPAFRANRPGTPLPPNLAGRTAAAFALAAQIDATRRPEAARSELDTAAQIFAAAKNTNVRPGDVVTALPHAFYPESSWRDDLELAAAELARAGQALTDPRTSGWLTQGQHWAHEYLAHEAGDATLNLYDTSALAHADLIAALRAAHSPGEAPLLADLRAQLDRGAARARRDPFRAGAIYDDFDAASHAFGLTATAALYRALTGDARYASFATEQRDWALGANAWGASLMIGVGSRYPRCPQHVVANLTGRTLRGGVVNGPNDRGQFAGGLGDFFSNGRTCPADGRDPYRQFTGHGSRFVDDVRAWQTVEPAIDFTATAALAFAVSASP